MDGAFGPCGRVCFCEGIEVFALFSLEATLAPVGLLESPLGGPGRAIFVKFRQGWVREILLRRGKYRSVAGACLRGHLAGQWD